MSDIYLPIFNNELCQGTLGQGITFSAWLLATCHVTILPSSAKKTDLTNRPHDPTWLFLEHEATTLAHAFPRDNVCKLQGEMFHNTFISYSVPWNVPMLITYPFKNKISHAWEGLGAGGEEDDRG